MTTTAVSEAFILCRTRARKPAALVGALLLAVGAAGLVGCKGNSGESGSGTSTVTTTTGAAPGKAAGGGSILIGEYGSLSGDTATFGTSTDEGIELAINKANAEGGVLGKKLAVVVKDDRSNADATAQTVEALISQNVVAVLGEVASTRSLRGAPICEEKKIPMISPASTNPKVTQVGDDIFRVCFIDQFQGRAIAEIGTDILHARNAVILYDNGQDYSKGLRDFIKQNFVARGGHISGELSYSKETTNFSGQLTTIKQLAPDVIFVPGYYNQVGQIARQARTMGIAAPLVGGDGWDSPELTKIAAGGLENCYFTDHFSPDDKSPVVQTFVKSFEAANGGKAPDAMAALGYDAIGILVDAIKRAGTTDRFALRDALAKTKDYKGVTGTITIGPDRNAIKPVVVVKIVNGKFTFATRITP